MLLRTKKPLPLTPQYTWTCSLEIRTDELHLRFFLYKIDFRDFFFQEYVKWVYLTFRLVFLGNNDFFEFFWTKLHKRRDAFFRSTDQENHYQKWLRRWNRTRDPSSYFWCFWQRSTIEPTASFYFEPALGSTIRDQNPMPLYFFVFSCFSFLVQRNMRRVDWYRCGVSRLESNDFRLHDNPTIQKLFK